MRVRHSPWPMVSAPQMGAFINKSSGVYHQQNYGLFQPSLEEDKTGLGLSVHKIQLFSGQCQALIRTVKVGTYHEK